VSAGSEATRQDQADGLSSETQDFITRTVEQVVEGIAARLDALSEQLAAIHAAQARGTANQASLTTAPQKGDAQRGYRQLVMRTLESLDAASRNLDTLRKEMENLRESVDTVDRQAAGVVQGIKAIRERLDEIHACMDMEEDDPRAGEGEEEA
jgi:prefoldin subunit 5